MERRNRYFKRVKLLNKSIRSEDQSQNTYLNKETRTLGERIRNLFKEKGITAVFILTAVGMAMGFLIESLLGAPTVSTTRSGNTSVGDRKGGGARE